MSAWFDRRMRALLAILALAGALVAATEPEPPRGKLADMRSNAVYVLEQSDGVQCAERLVTVRHPRCRIIHIADLHLIDRDDLAADLRDQDPDVTDDDIDNEYMAVLNAIARVQI